MRIKPLHHNFIMPTKSTEGAGAFDIYMSESGSVCGPDPVFVPLGFAAEVPPGYVAIILPRSGVGSKRGLELFNTAGVIDSDYRGEWKAALRLKNAGQYQWDAGDRLLQFLIIPVANVTLELVKELDITDRGIDGFGSSGR